MAKTAGGTGLMSTVPGFCCVRVNGPVRTRMRRTSCKRPSCVIGATSGTFRAIRRPCWLPRLGARLWTMADENRGERDVKRRPKMGWTRRTDFLKRLKGQPTRADWSWRPLWKGCRSSSERCWCLRSGTNLRLSRLPGPLRFRPIRLLAAIAMPSLLYARK